MANCTGGVSRRIVDSWNPLDDREFSRLMMLVLGLGFSRCFSACEGIPPDTPVVRITAVCVAAAAFYLSLAIGVSFRDRGMRNDSHDAVAVVIEPRGASQSAEESLPPVPVWPGGVECSSCLRHFYPLWLGTIRWLARQCCPHSGVDGPSWSG